MQLFYLSVKRFRKRRNKNQNKKRNGLIDHRTGNIPQTRYVTRKVESSPIFMILRGIHRHWVRPILVSNVFLI